MNKILYAEGDYTASAIPLTIVGVDITGESFNWEQHRADKAFPNNRVQLDQMLAYKDHEIEIEPPRLGDVFWSQTQKNKIVAHVFCYENKKFDVQALGRALKMINIRLKKHNLMEEDRFAVMPAIGGVDNWENTYEIIEEAMGEVQTVVYAKDNPELLKILDCFEVYNEYSTEVEHPE
jgi:hypothetical protein